MVLQGRRGYYYYYGGLPIVRRDFTAEPRLFKQLPHDMAMTGTLAFALITPPYGLAPLMATKFIGARFRLFQESSGSEYIGS